MGTGSTSCTTTVQPGYLNILQMGDTDARHKSRKTEYEVKPQYEELSKQLNMQHAINQCYECMKAIKESDSKTSLSTGKSNQASIPLTANQPVESSVRDHRGPSAHHSSVVDTRIR
ncbi:mediator-associated protein 1-like [Dorcoceras hygrometricum]|uniref:Mediator-associated protein 1-like n=1 Tax=Dorcoceras hygrometricum TaxID=472368 RepID=A0A2Z7CFP0_9LAMI|nr:mediator-associated protein 1-like [Dorcoceras hygrometricum]